MTEIQQDHGYIYLLITRECIRTQSPVFKIGSTIDIFGRLREYADGSRLIACWYVDDCRKTEREIINSLKGRFTQQHVYGSEYFEGEIKEIYNTIVSHLIVSISPSIMRDVQYRKGTRGGAVDKPTTETDSSENKQGDATKTKKESTEVIVRTFFESITAEYKGRIKCSDLYSRFNIWQLQQDSMLQRQIAYERFKSEVRKSSSRTATIRYFTCTEEVHFPDGGSHINPTEQFVAEYISKGDPTDYFVLSTAKAVFSQCKYFHNKTGNFKCVLEDLLKTKCFAQKRIGHRNLTNVYMGFKLLVPDNRAEYDNVVGTFIAEEFEVTKNENDVVSAEDTYMRFCKSSHFNGKDKKWLGEQMSANGFASEKCNVRGPYRQKRVYRGLVFIGCGCDLDGLT